MAADRIGDGLGSLVVEATATLTILVYLAVIAAGTTLLAACSDDETAGSNAASTTAADSTSPTENS